MPKPKYTDSNLIKYEDAIQLHFDTTGKFAWLTMKNYGLVFYEWPWATPWDQVKEVTIGIPAGTFELREASVFLSANKDLFNNRDEVRATTEYYITISISAMLDAVSVIQLQTELIRRMKRYSHNGQPWENNAVVTNREGYSRQFLYAKIHEALSTLGVVPIPFREGIPERFFANTVANLIGSLRKPPGALWIQRDIQQHRRWKTGFTAYFPKVAFIVQEQRTKLLDGEGGKTKNEDARFILPIAFPSSNPISLEVGHKATDRKIFDYKEYFDELDKDREKNEEEFVGQNEDRKAYLDRANFPRGAAYLHKHLSQINCYAFRGEKRDPIEIKKADGIIAGVTRTDDGVKDKKQVADKIDEALKRRTVGGEEYKKVLQDLDILTLGVYTVDSEFKGFVSTTKSIAIAKCFANKYAKPNNLYASTYLYAVRCRSGFHLPSDAIKLDGEEWSRGKDAQNAFTHYAEQEVAVAGAIFWNDVVGVRLIRVDANGQYFSGPVFMRDLLRQECHDQLKAVGGDYVTHQGQRVKVWLPDPDDGAFCELFELFSGKCQGKADGIEWSYPDSPFDCPDTVMKLRDNTSRGDFDIY